MWLAYLDIILALGCSLQAGIWQPSQPWHPWEQCVGLCRAQNWKDKDTSKHNRAVKGRHHMNYE